MTRACNPTSSVVISDDLYDSANCSAILGRFLFRHSEGPTQPIQSDAVLRFCIGDGEWITSPGGVEAMQNLVRTQIAVMDMDGVRPSEYPEDWGVIADEEGVIVMRASSNESISFLTYLGVAGKPVASGPLTIDEAGLVRPHNRPRERA